MILPRRFAAGLFCLVWGEEGENNFLYVLNYRFFIKNIVLLKYDFGKAFCKMGWRKKPIA